MLILKTFTEKECYQSQNIKGILDKLLLNTLIIQDSQGKYFSDLYRALKKIDNQNHRVNVALLLSYFKKNNRFVNHRSLNYDHCNLLNKLIRDLTKCDIDAFISESTKKLDNKNQPFEYIELKDFDYSGFNEKIKNNEWIKIEGDLRSEDNFKYKVLKPIFENSKNSIELFDRHIARSGIDTKRNMNRALKTLNWNYQYTMRLIIQSFLEYSDNSKMRSFKLTSGIKRLPRDLEEVKECFLNLLAPFINEPNFEYEIEIRDESLKNELEHERYLFTNVFNYFFGPGFGFFHNRGLPAAELKIRHISKKEAKGIKEDTKRLKMLMPIITNKKTT